VKRVLLIDDHALFREGLALLLEGQLSLESVQAESLAEGHRVLSAVEDVADFAIIDLDLPDGDGTELIEQLHEIEPGVPVLALAAGRGLAERARALEAGADEVLTKATPVEQIIDAVERMKRG
jgi:DNA-binding NarL/FixJ family response regulator